MNEASTQAIIIANDLRTGRVVYFTKESGWSEAIDEAQRLTDESANERLAAATIDERNNLVIDPTLAQATVSADTDRFTLENIREQIRVSGPTILGSDHASTSQAA